MKQKALSSLVLLLFFLPLCAAGQKEGEYYVKNIGIAEGLSQSSVSCILYDGISSLWIGTRYGLNEYRNHSMRSFGEDYINVLFTDSSGTLWCGSNQGLYTFDREQENLVKHRAGSAYCACQAEDGGIYFGCRDCLIYIKDGEETVYPFDGAMISGIHPWKEELILVDKGLGLMSFAKGQISRHSHSDIDGSVVLASAQKDSLLYLSIFRKGVLELDLERQSSRFLDKAEIGSDIVLCLQFIGDELWMGTDGQGIIIYGSEDGSILRQNLPSNSVTAIYADPFSNIWAGTVRSGLFGLRASPILSFNSSNSKISDDVVISLCREGQDKLWLGTDGEGINLFDENSKNIQPLVFTQGMKISSMASLGKGKLLASVYGQGLQVIDAEKESISPLLLIDEATNRRECYYGNAPQLYNLDNGHILIMAINVYDYNPRNGRFSIYSPSNTLSIAEMQLISKDFAFTSDQLFRLDSENLKIENLGIGLQGRKINSAAQIGDSLWIGTGTGLLSYNLQSGEIQEVKTRLFNRISRLQASGDELWIAADNTLFRKRGSKIELMGENEGIAANEILTGLSDENQLYLGGTKGLIRINRDIRHKEQFQPRQQLQILSLSMGGRKLSPDKGTLRLPSSFPAISINFGLSMADPFDRYVYRYEVEGKTDYSIETYDDFLVLHDLQSGRYEIRAAVLGPEGNWSDAVKLLNIRVLRPWYAQIWFLALIAAIVLSSVIYLVIKLYHKKMKRLEQQMRAMNSGFMHKFDSLILENISNPALDISMITSNMTMSRASLYNKVKEITGKGIWEYIEEVRMRKACELLLNTASSISDISEQCGFGSSRYFSTRFKKCRGCTPREFRKRKED